MDSLCAWTWTTENKKTVQHPPTKFGGKKKPLDQTGSKTLDHARVHWLPKIWSTLERVESKFWQKKAKSIPTIQSSAETVCRLDTSIRWKPISVPRQTRFCCILVDCTVGSNCSYFFIYSYFVRNKNFCISEFIFCPNLTHCASFHAQMRPPHFFWLIYLPTTNQKTIHRNR